MQSRASILLWPLQGAVMGSAQARAFSTTTGLQEGSTTEDTSKASR